MDGVEITARPPLAAAVALLQAAELPIEDLTDSHLEHFFMAGSPESPVRARRSGVVRPPCPAAVAGGRSAASAPPGSAHDWSSMPRRMHALVARNRSTCSRQRQSGFFSARGYARAERSTAPESIRGTREFASLCPASSAFMIKHLSE